VKEGFDLAVRAGPLVDSSLLARKLGEGEVGLFASPACLDRAGRSRRLSDLARHDCILYRSASATAIWRLSGPRGEEEVSVRGRVETDEFAFVRASARDGAGIAFTPIGMVAALVESGELERVLPRYALRGAPVHIVWPSRRFEPAAVRLLRDALVEALAPTVT
jgi:DNA-binding transcriptional LysR family regulator